MKNVKRIVFGAIGICLGLVLVASEANLAWAQSNELDKAERAHVIFDVDLDEIRQNELVKEIGLEALLDQGDMLPSEDEFDVKTLARVYGAFQLPEDTASVMSMGPQDDLPFNFFVRLEFNDAKGIEQILDEITSSEGTRVTERAGQTYYSPPEQQGPGNLLVTRVEEKVLEVGTSDYLYLEDRNVVTEATKNLWLELPQESVRLAVDLSERQELVESMLELLSMDIGEEGVEMFQFVKDIRSLRFHMQPGSDKLFSVMAGADTAEKADELKGMLDSLLFLGRMGAKQAVREMPLEDNPEVTKMLNSLVDSFKAAVSGKDVVIAVPVPEGFEQMILEVLVPMLKKQAAEIEQQNKYRQVAIAIHNYADAYRKFPFRARKELSWRAAVLPFMWENEYEGIDMDANWDSEENLKFAKRAPQMFIKPEIEMDESLSCICWIESDVDTFAEIRDGTSNTIMLMENPVGVSWMKPGDLTQDEAVKIFENLKEGQSLVVVMYDASTRMINKDELSIEEFRALLTPNGGEVVNY